MNQVFPKIANVTDLRYRWSQLIKELEESELPILVVDHSTPRAVIFSFSQAKKFMKGQGLITPENDPLLEWRVKHARKFSGWDATKLIRKARDARWNLS